MPGAQVDDDDESITDPDLPPLNKAAASCRVARSAKKMAVIEWSSESEDNARMTTDTMQRKRAAAH